MAGKGKAILGAAKAAGKAAKGRKANTRQYGVYEESSRTRAWGGKDKKYLLQTPKRTPTKRREVAVGTTHASDWGGNHPDRYGHTRLQVKNNRAKTKHTKSKERKIGKVVVGNKSPIEKGQRYEKRSTYNVSGRFHLFPGGSKSEITPAHGDKHAVKTKVHEIRPLNMYYLALAGSGGAEGEEISKKLKSKKASQPFYKRTSRGKTQRVKNANYLQRRLG